MIPFVPKGANPKRQRESIKTPCPLLYPTVNELSIEKDRPRLKVMARNYIQGVPYTLPYMKNKSTVFFSLDRRKMIRHSSRTKKPTMVFSLPDLSDHFFVTPVYLLAFLFFKLRSYLVPTVSLNNQPVRFSYKQDMCCRLYRAPKTSVGICQILGGTCQSSTCQGGTCQTGKFLTRNTPIPTFSQKTPKIQKTLKRTFFATAQKVQQNQTVPQENLFSQLPESFQYVTGEKMGQKWEILKNRKFFFNEIADLTPVFGRLPLINLIKLKLINLNLSFKEETKALALDKTKIEKSGKSDEN